MSTSTGSLPLREVRYAVVMYGGVSLAIYIHGVARELWHLVRATARKPDGSAVIPVEKLTATERVYRKLSHVLPEIDGNESAYRSLKEFNDAVQEKKLLDHAGPVRFVVDIISGTSAGGINGIFLAKALAANQDLSPLRDLWLSDGDLATLLNDTRSRIGFPDLTVADPPASLLNSARMYRLLLKALNRMEPGTTAQAPVESQFVEQLDLFVTTTDIHGLILPIQLADMKVDERRHRNVFQFVYASGHDQELPLSGPAGGADRVPYGRNDFASRHIPFLAFAARCTSSFPFAFEPMQLGDIDVHLTPSPDDDTRKEWARLFYRDYGTDKQDQEFWRRSFGDGGYLDNKPFGHATRALGSRRADLPVDRKLLYIEPAPEQLEAEADAPLPPRPDALENALAAAMTLPARETIREDIERIHARNQTIRRMRRVAENIDRDIVKKRRRAMLTVTGTDLDQERVKRVKKEADQEKAQPGTLIEQWKNFYLGDLIRREGLAFVAYHRLKVAETTDDLTEIIAPLVNIRAGTDTFRALRLVVQTWRDNNYQAFEGDVGTGVPSQNRFLFEFNFGYCLRRLLFLRSRLDELARFREEIWAPLFTVSMPEPATGEAEGREPKVPAEEKLPPVEDRPVWRQQIDKLRKHVTALHAALLHERRRLRGSIAGPFVEVVLKLGMKPDALLELLDHSSDEACRKAAEDFYKENERRGAIDAAMVLLRGRCLTIFGFSEDRCKDMLKPPDTRPAGEANSASAVQWKLKRLLWYFYDYYEDYDQYLYPLMYGTDTEESDVVDIFRVSPGDATRLVDENKKEERCTKLGGTFLANFGAFLDPLWRQSDMMWGRLDGAERLVCSLLPKDVVADDLRNALIAEAQAGIVAEETKGLSPCQGQRLLVECLMRPANRRSLDDALESLASKLTKGLFELYPEEKAREKKRLEKLELARQGKNLPEEHPAPADPAPDPEFVRLQALLDPGELKLTYQHAFKRDQRPEPEEALQAAARAATISGRVLEGIAEKRNALQKPATWLVRLGRMAVLLVETALPRSYGEVLRRYWTGLALICAGAMLVAGLTLNQEQLAKYGGLLAALVIGFNVVANRLNRLMLRGWSEATRLRRILMGIWRVVLLLALLVVAALVTLGARQAWQSHTRWWEKAKAYFGCPPKDAPATTPH